MVALVETFTRKKLGKVREQIVDDPLSGMVLEFRVISGSQVPYRLRIYTPSAHVDGHVVREISFDRSGRRDEAGVHAERISRLGEVLRRTRSELTFRQGSLLGPLAHRLLKRLLSPARRSELRRTRSDPHRSKEDRL